MRFFLLLGFLLWGGAARAEPLERRYDWLGPTVEVGYSIGSPARLHVRTTHDGAHPVEYDDWIWSPGGVFVRAEKGYRYFRVGGGAQFAFLSADEGAENRTLLLLATGSFAFETPGLGPRRRFRMRVGPELGLGMGRTSVEPLGPRTRGELALTIGGSLGFSVLGARQGMAWDLGVVHVGLLDRDSNDNRYGSRTDLVSARISWVFRLHAWRRR